MEMAAKTQFEKGKGHEVATKRSGTKTKSVGAARRGKPQVKRELKDLDVRKAKGVRGGALTLKQK